METRRTTRAEVEDLLRRAGIAVPEEEMAELVDGADVIRGILDRLRTRGSGALDAAASGRAGALDSGGRA